MKKIFFSLILIVGAFQLSFNQTLKLCDLNNQTINSGDTIQIDSLPSVDEMTLYMKVINLSASSISLRCEKFYCSVVPSTSDEFCFAGSCYPPTTMISNNQLIAAGDTNSEFSSHYIPSNQEGVTLIGYVFRINHGDTACFYVKYNANHPLKLFSQNSIGLNYGDTISIDSLSSVSEMIAHVKVKNEYANEINVVVKKQYENIVNGTVNDFYWPGHCPSTTYISPTSIVILGGDTSDAFTGHYFPYYINGTSLIKYIFIADNNDSAWVYVKYNVTQTLQIYTDNDIFLHNGDIITIDSLSTDTILPNELISNLKIKNTNINAKNVFCEKQYQFIVSGTDNDFYWAGSNIPDSIFVSPLLLLNGGTITSEFIGHYMPNNNIGTSIIKYVFKVENGDSAWIFIKYNANFVGIIENNLSPVISTPYPNPSSGIAYVNYDIPAGSKAFLQVMSICGKIEKQYSLTESNGTLQMNISDMSSGIYFCSLTINNKVVKTSKLIISH
jgi:hypothetical protein